MYSPFRTGLVLHSVLTCCLWPRYSSSQKFIHTFYYLGISILTCSPWYILFSNGGFVHSARSQQTFRRPSTAAAALVWTWIPYFPRISSFLMNKGIFSVHIKSAAAAICLEMVKVQFHIKLMCTVFCPKSFRRVRALSASVISEALVFFLFFFNIRWSHSPVWQYEEFWRGCRFIFCASLGAFWVVWPAVFTGCAPLSLSLCLCMLKVKFSVFAVLKSVQWLGFRLTFVGHRFLQVTFVTESEIDLAVLGLLVCVFWL